MIGALPDHCGSALKISMNGNQRLGKGRPFWLPASTYYFLAAAVAIGVFFLVWAILGDTRDENPWIPAGLMASTSMIAAVVVREVILRIRRESVVAAQRKLDQSLRPVPILVRDESQPKLTLERNRILLEEINRKSEAANVLGRLAESHREVFELCAAYLEIAKRELPSVRVGSPRLAAITRGRDRAERIHRRHMLKWAEIEIKSNTEAALGPDLPSFRSESAEKALRAARIAFEHYPEEENVVRSLQAVEGLVYSLKAADALRLSAGAEERGDLEMALAFAIDAEEFAARIRPGGDGKSLTRIRDDIERLKRLKGNAL